MKKSILFFSILLLANSNLAFGASFFNDRVSVQGFLKSNGNALHDAAGFPMQFTLRRNGVAVWCQTSASPVPVINGVFSQVLSGNSNCQSLSNALNPSVFAHSANSDIFTVDVVVDALKDGFGSSDDATFAGIDLVSSPLAIYADQANSANTVSGTVAVTNGGTGATSAASARSNLGLGPLATLALSGNASDVLKGDGTFGPGSAGGGTLAGDVSGSTSATSVDKIKGRALSTSAPSSGQVLTWNSSSSQWEPQTPSVSAVTSVAGRTGAVTLSSSDISDATNANTANMIVKRDASGNFTAATITATLNGNATNVTGTVAIANGGTGATSAASARTNLGAAASGANTDITSINGSALQATMVMSPLSGGTASAYTLTNSPALSSLSAGQTLSFRVNATNSAGATLNVDGLGAKPIYSMLTGAAVAAGDLMANKVVQVTYDGTNFLADISPQQINSGNLNCGGTITANSNATCPNITAATVNAGDVVQCSPSADPSSAGGTVTWSALSTAGNISIRLACNSSSNCGLSNRTWRCVVFK